jgi:hypothetical protein
MKPEMNAEERLEAVARKLGDRAAASFDAEATAQKVVARLRKSERPVARVVRLVARVAAVAVIAVAVSVVWQVRSNVVESSYAVPDEIADMTEDELTEVFDSLYFEAPVYEVAGSDIYDMDEDELVQLLEMMES